MPLCTNVFIFTIILINLAFFICEETNNPKCDGFQAKFSYKEVVGIWNVVAIIPEKLFPENQVVTCYKVEFSETDVAGLRWLANSTKTLDKPKYNLTKNITGSIIRQRYFSEKPFDVWSKSLNGVNGCFQQVLYMRLNKTSGDGLAPQDSIMQIHLLDASGGPYLLQMLWGKLISVVVYRKEQGITEEELRPVLEFTSKLRGPQRQPKICTEPLKDLMLLNNVKE